MTFKYMYTAMCVGAWVPKYKQPKDTYLAMANKDCIISVAGNMSSRLCIPRGFS